MYNCCFVKKQKDYVKSKNKYFSLKTQVMYNVGFV